MPTNPRKLAAIITTIAFFIVCLLSERLE